MYGCDGCVAHDGAVDLVLPRHNLEASMSHIINTAIIIRIHAVQLES
jgi:hypothetical protein